MHHTQILANTQLYTTLHRTLQICRHIMPILSLHFLEDIPYFLCQSTTRPVKPSKKNIPPSTDFHSGDEWFISAKLCLKLMRYTEYWEHKKS